MGSLVFSMRRTWPCAFLIAFLLILNFHRTPSAPTLVRTTARPVAEEVDVSPPVQSLAASALKETIEPQAKNGEATPAQPRSPMLAGLLWALRNQNEDGSWGDRPTTLGNCTIGKTGVTSLVLVALIGAGYSHLSHDEYDEVAVGPRMRKALNWLLLQQAPEGVFRSGFDDLFEQTLATFAVNEAYGQTGSVLLKDPATLALDALVRLQGADGSWGGGTPTPWAVEALVSAASNELPTSKENRDRALAFLRNRSHPAELAALHQTRELGDLDRMEALAQSIARSPPRPGETDFEAIYQQATGLFLYDGIDGVLWKKWAPAAKEAILGQQNADGSWNGASLSHRLVRTSLAEYSLQIYYRYSGKFTIGR
jgi:hypothetical protein